MHELSLLEELRRQALTAAEAQGVSCIEAITLRIGTLAGVEPEGLRLAFPLVMAGTIAASARLVLEIEAAVCICEPCGSRFEARDGCCDCPRCGRISRRLLSGRDLQLVALEVSGGPDD
ncbi:MAG: hydrogenase maturation nickel metallochaperone HypA [Synechococcus sp.]|nr:hydrogenase maturation nickel metallochaperone HypA [Synechococcus sp.]